MLLKSLQDSLSQIDTILARIDSLPPDAAQAVYVGQRIGCHVRHVTDHFTALLKLSGSDTVDYNERSRNSPVETHISEARSLIVEQIGAVEELALGDRSVICLSEVDVHQTETLSFKSTADREALWVLNHTIHHIALIKIIAEQSGVSLDANLGLAPATATFQRASN